MLSIWNSLKFYCLVKRNPLTYNCLSPINFAISRGFFTKKVTPSIGFFLSANFPQEKYFSPSNQFFPQEINFPYIDTKYCYAIW